MIALVSNGSAGSMREAGTPPPTHAINGFFAPRHIPPPPDLKAKSSNGINVAALSRSPLYRDFRRAFVQGTGLPLSLSTPHRFDLIRFARGQKNSFAALITKTDSGRLHSSALQHRLEEKAQLRSQTLMCFAGLCHSAVPVRVGDKLIGFLHTGHVLLHHPDKTRFDRIARKLADRTPKFDFKKTEQAYFRTRTIPPAQYESLIGLLAIFAEQLGAAGSQLGLHADHAEPAAVARAREIIDRQSHNGVSLGQIAKLVNVSANYFSELFHKTTGIRFVDYVARVRVEKAKEKLHNSRARISEVAYEVGFQSLSQFNRAFKTFAGEAPKEFRARSSGAA
jgi:AraC-like DNA-binding protein